MQEKERTAVIKETRLRLHPAKNPHVEKKISFNVLEARWKQEMHAHVPCTEVEYCITGCLTISIDTQMTDCSNININII
ncbi:hypothetical protein E2C01_067372 [Portunus trituberculatus]|uniref:Uncharacterized protein n=1 Tax=Portunus trituberculatus TaxID=210409 RepID=A0A5B7HX97_PORTR|nr:hypothetical protein [Portunus trituberculatus]